MADTGLTASQRAFHRSIAEGLDGILNGTNQPKAVGFALFIFRFGETAGGQVNYVSNAQREDMLVAVRDWLARAEGRVIETDTPQ